MEPVGVYYSVGVLCICCACGFESVCGDVGVLCICCGCGFEMHVMCVVSARVHPH